MSLYLFYLRIRVLKCSFCLALILRTHQNVYLNCDLQMSQDNSNESPVETSSMMDLADQTTDVFDEESSSSSNDTDVGESNGDMLSAIRGIGARHGPLRPAREGFIPPARRSSTGTSAFTMSDDDEDDEDESLSVSASDMIR